MDIQIILEVVAQTLVNTPPQRVDPPRHPPQRVVIEQFFAREVLPDGPPSSPHLAKTASDQICPVISLVCNVAFPPPRWGRPR